MTTAVPLTHFCAPVWGIGCFLPDRAERGDGAVRHRAAHRQPP